MSTSTGTGANPTTILVDTNVWLDNYLPNRPGSPAARRFLTQATHAGMQLLYPVHSLKDVYHIIQSSLKHDAQEEGELTESAAEAIRQVARACVENMRERATAVGADESDVWMACRYLPFNDDLEDNFVLAAALRAQVDYLVTSDETLLKKATVPALSPEDASRLIEIGMR